MEPLNRDLVPINAYEGIEFIDNQSRRESLAVLSNYLIAALWKDKCYQAVVAENAERLYSEGIDKLIEAQILSIEIKPIIFDPLTVQLKNASDKIMNEIINKYQLKPNVNEIRLKIETKTNDLPYIQSKYINEFKFIKLLGKGGFGKVNKVQKKSDENEYAIKIIKSNNENEFKYTYREITQFSKFNHPNIVRYYEAWCELDQDIPILSQTEYESELSNSIQYEDTNGSAIIDQSRNGDDRIVDLKADNDDSSGDGIRRDRRRYSNLKYITFYILMEACDTSLQEYLEDDNFDIYKRRLILKQITEGLNYLHLMEIMHRDLKPQNILLNIVNQTVIAKIADFGLSRKEFLSFQDVSDITNISNLFINENLTMNIGTTLYIAPEILNAENASEQCYSRKADVYSLGIIFFELFNKIKTKSERYKKIESVRNYHEKLDEEFQKEEILMYRMLDKNVDNRPTTKEILESDMFKMNCVKCQKLKEMNLLLKKEIDILKASTRIQKEMQ